MNRFTSASRSARRTLWSCFLALACALGTVPLSAQIPDSAQIALAGDAVYEVRLQDGSVLLGRFVEVEGPRIVLVTQGGLRVELQRAQIRDARRVGGSVGTDRELWPQDPNRTRLFFGPTGRALQAGEGYVGAFELFLPFVAIGLTDWFTIAGGTPIVPEAIGRIWYLAPRLQIVDSEDVQISTGALAFFDLADEGADPSTVGIFFGAGTFGSSDQALTVGAGWGFAGDDVENQPAFMVGGEARVSPRVKLITENYFMSLDDEEILLVGAGIRLFGQQMTGDLGLGFGGGSSDFGCCIPLVNFVYNFGSGR